MKVWPYAQTCDPSLSHERSILALYNFHHNGATVPIHNTGTVTANNCHQPIPQAPVPRPHEYLADHVQ
eukprot:3828474-Karenia_brevis.AAC.1